MRPLGALTPPAADSQGGSDVTIRRYGRHWAVFDDNGGIVCVTVYKRGAQAVVDRLAHVNPAATERTMDVGLLDSRHVELEGGECAHTGC